MSRLTVTRLMTVLHHKARMTQNDIQTAGKQLLQRRGDPPNGFEPCRRRHRPPPKDIKNSDDFEDNIIIALCGSYYWRSSMAVVSAPSGQHDFSVKEKKAYCVVCLQSADRWGTCSCGRPAHIRRQWLRVGRNFHRTLPLAPFRMPDQTGSAPAPLTRTAYR